MPIETIAVDREQPHEAGESPGAYEFIESYHQIEGWWESHDKLAEVPTNFATARDSDATGRRGGGTMTLPRRQSLTSRSMLLVRVSKERP